MMKIRIFIVLALCFGLNGFSQGGKKVKIDDSTIALIKSLGYKKIESLTDAYASKKYFKVWKKKSDKKFDVVNEKGKLIFDRQLDEVAFPNYINIVLVGKSNGKYAMASEQKSSGFIFDNVLFSKEDFYINNKNLYVVEAKGSKMLYSLDLNQLFFKSLQLKEIKNINMTEEMLCSEYWFVKKDENYALAIWNDQNKQFDISNYNISRFDVNEDYDIFKAPILKIYSKTKEGWFNAENLDTLVPMIYQSISSEAKEFNGFDYLEVKQNNKLGLFHVENKKQHLPCEFDFIQNINDDFHVKKGDFYGVFHYNSTQLKCNIIYKNKFTDESYSEMFLVENALDAFKNGKDCKCYLQDEKYEVCFEQLLPIKKTENYIALVNKKRGIVSSLGDTILPVDYSKIENSGINDLGLILYRGDSLYIFDGSSELMINNIAYSEIAVNKDQKVYTVKRAGKYGLLADFTEVIPLDYDELLVQNEHVYLRKGKLWGAFNKDFSNVVAFKYSSLEEVQNLTKK